MGTEVHCKSHIPGYYSMRDTNEDSNSSSWSLFYGDKSLLNGQYYNGFMLRTVPDGYPAYEKDLLRQKMLEHEAIFKNQVYELHRLYRVQRDIMQEVKRKELYKHRISIETSSSSNFLLSQMPSDEARNWHNPSFLLHNGGCVRPSILGSEIIDSPLSSTKGNGSQAARVPNQNKCSFMDCAFLESRPSKVRKKLFDLELPSDEDIDTEEGQHFRDTKISYVSSYPPNGNHRLATENSVKLFFGGGKTDCHRDTSSDSSVKSSRELADLNEPIRVEEDTHPLSVDFLGHSACHGENRGLNLSAKPKPQFVDLTQEISQNSENGSSHGNSNTASVANKGIRTGWLSYICEAGNSRRDPNNIPKFLQSGQLPISSHPTQFMLDKPQEHPDIFSTGFRREEPWVERNYSYDFPDRSRNHMDSVVASRKSNPDPFVNSSDIPNSWSQSITSWGKPKASLTQKLTSAHARPSHISSETLCRAHEIFGDKWHANGSSSMNPGLGSDIPTQNGFYHGSSSGSKEQLVNLSSSGFDSLNCSKIDIVASEHLINQGSRNFFKGPDVMDLTPRKDLDLNVALPKKSFNEAAPQQVLEILDGKRKSEDHLSVLPWLREKPASCNQLLKNETVKNTDLLFTQNVSSSSSGPDVGIERESGNCLSNGKVLGVSIFGKFCTSKNDSSSIVSTSASVHLDIKNEGKHRGIDINVAFDLMDSESDKQIAAETVVAEKGMGTKLNNLRNIDLNSCISEDDNLLGSSLASTSPKVKIPLEIDLEAPFVLETEEEAILPREEHNQHEAPLEGDEIVRNVAEAIVDISYGVDNHFETSLQDSLLWFAEVISLGEDLEAPKELDYFEAMTLQLTETREEDYMPKPFVPEIQEADEMGLTSLPSRTRRGPARRGRPRRDFQRDILPGLVSLSRHEVTEDLQTFGSLMRATGHQWNGRTGTRSGAARGRRRCVVDPPPPAVVSSLIHQQLNSTIEVRVEDRSLTGWGKTTRRPRRQRSCTAGNNLAVALT